MSPDAGLVFGLLPKPVAVALAIILALVYVITEVTGKLNGPLSKFLDGRKRKREQQVKGWGERDRQVKVLEATVERLEHERDQRVEELNQTLALVNQQVEYLLGRVQAQSEELVLVHKISDAQARAIRKHLEWDRSWTQKARDAGIEIPDPPPTLYVDTDGGGE